MSGGTDRRNLSRKVKTAESWDKKLSEYDRCVTRELQTGRLPQTTTATPKRKVISVTTKSPGIKLSKPNLFATQPAAIPPIRASSRLGGKNIRCVTRELQTGRLPLTTTATPKPKIISATTKSLGIKLSKPNLSATQPVAKPPMRASSRLGVKNKRIDVPVPVASKRPRRNVEPQPHVSETESDSDLENLPPPVLSPYYADDIKHKGKKRVKGEHSTGFSTSASPVDELPTPDPTPSTSVVNKFDYFKYDQMELFGDLENEEERVQEYKPGEHYAADIGECLSAPRTGYNYQITRKMGFGNFSLAWLAYETNEKQERKFVALKIYKANNKSTNEEIKNLKKVKSHDHIVRYYRSFKITRDGFKHDCAVFEPLGSTLLTLLKRANNGNEAHVGLTVAAIKKVARHVLLGLQHLHEVLNFVHTDIKPENILTSVTERSLFLAVKDVHDCDCKNDGIRAVSLRDKPLKNGLHEVKRDLQKILADTPLPLSTVPAYKIDNRNTVSDEICWDVIRFKIIDLGNAVSPSNDPTVSGTFEYRAPENAFGAPLNYSFDVWSVGAVIVELATNKQLFTSVNKNHDSRDLLKSITRYLGKVPYDIYKEFKDSNQFLDEFSTSSVVNIFQRVNLKQIFSPKHFTQQEIKEMVAFLAYVFTYDPSERPTVAKCLEHKWLST